LLDFKQLHHVSPSFILNASVGYAFRVWRCGRSAQRFYVENVFDKQYLLKGAFFSGASLRQAAASAADEHRS